MASPQDLLNANANLATLDAVVTSTAETTTDRLGQTKLTLSGFEDRATAAIQSTGWFIVGEFSAGFTYTARNQVGRDADGELWSYNGPFTDGSFVVSAGTVPSEPNYTNRGDAALRTDIAPVPSIKQLRPTAGVVQTAEAYVEDTGFGGGPFIFYPDMPESEHNGGTVIAEGARLAWNGTQADIATILNYSGSGSGCYVRQGADGATARLTDYGFSGLISEFNLIVPKILSANYKTMTSEIAVNVTSQTEILSNIELHNIDFTGTSIVRHTINTVFYNCSFSGGVRGRPKYDSENSSYLLCEFSANSYIDCESGFNRGPRFLSVSLCKTDLSPLIFGTTLNDSSITLNQIDATGRGFAISYAGSGNKITQNDVKGGTTGIIGIPVRSANQRQSISGNIVAFNTVYDQTEESISLDCRGNSNTDGLILTEAQVSAQTSNSISIDVTLPAFTGINQYVIFHTGPKAGQFFKIVFRGSDGIGAYQLDNYIGTSGDVGQTITIGLGSFNNSIFNNTVRNAGITGIMVYGAFVGTSIDFNKVYDCPITVESLAGITSEYRASRQPTHFTTITRNEVQGDVINIKSLAFGGATIINPVGIVAKDNPSDVVNTLSCVMQDTSGNKSYTGTNISVTKDTNEIVVKIPKMLMVNSVVTDIYEFSLPANFSVVVDVDAQIQLPQCVGSRKAAVLGYRSNETISLYGSSVFHDSLNTLEAQPVSRNVDSMELTSEIISSATINDTAKLKIKFAAAISGSSVTESTNYSFCATLKLRIIS